MGEQRREFSKAFKRESSAAQGPSQGTRDGARRRDEVAARQNVGEGLDPSRGSPQGAPLQSRRRPPADHPDGPLRQEGYRFRTQDPSPKDRSAKSPVASTPKPSKISRKERPAASTPQLR